MRGKVKAPVEFGAKLDLSIDMYGYARIENISFDVYNESTCLQDAVNAYYGWTGYYLERVLADYIEQEIIGHSAKSMAFGYPIRSLEDQAREQ